MFNIFMIVRNIEFVIQVGLGSITTYALVQLATS
jgi:hypothetical protein